MKRLPTLILIVLICLGLGIAATHSHTGEDCNLCKVLGPASTALFAMVVVITLELCPERPLREGRPAALQARHYLSPLRAPPRAPWLGATIA